MTIILNMFTELVLTLKYIGNNIPNRLNENL